jgi:hypothetical protein
MIDRLRRKLPTPVKAMAVAGNGCGNDGSDENLSRGDAVGVAPEETTDGPGTGRGDDSMSVGRAVRNRKRVSNAPHPRERPTSANAAKRRRSCPACVWDPAKKRWQSAGPRVKNTRPNLGLLGRKYRRLQQRANMVAMNYNRHRHCFSCRKGKRGKVGCRFMIPFAHNIDETRCIQLRKRTGDDHAAIDPDDVRWCKACVLGLRHQDEPFTEEEKHRMRLRIKERGLHYEQVDGVELPRSLVPGGQSLREVFEHLTRPDDRCLVVEVKRPCPPTKEAAMGADSGTEPAGIHALLDMLKEQLDREETLHSASFDAKEIETRLGNESGVEWLAKQCTAAHCDNGIVAEFCDILSAELECNTAVYHLGAGTTATAASTYFCKYNVKPQYDINYNMLVVISTAAEDIRRNPSRAADTGTPARTAKHLTQHIVNTGAERSATEAAMICLGQKAEDADDKLTSVNAWDLCDEACKLIGVEESDARAEHVVNEDDARSRNGITGDTSYRGTVSARHYTVGKEIVWVTVAQHYMFRSTKLRHLNAMEFFELYEVKSIKSIGGAVSSAGSVSSNTRGRKRQASYEFMRAHPLHATHACVLRAKVLLPMLTGGSPPPRPKRGSDCAGVCRWSKYYSSLLIPWGSTNGGAATRGGHFRPMVSMAEFVGWWQTLLAESVRYACHVDRQQKKVQGSSTNPFSVDDRTVLPFVDPAVWVDRIAGLGEGLRGVRRQRSVRDILEYRLFAVENVVLAFAAKQSVVNLANSHRGQGRTLWNEKNIPPEDRKAWGTDDIFDMLRVNRVDRELEECRRNGGRYLRAALNRATSNESLRKHVFDKLVVASDGPETASLVTEPTAVATDAAVGGGPDELAPPVNPLLPAQLVSSVDPAPVGTGRRWGKGAPAGFDRDACERAYDALCTPVAMRRSVRGGTYGSGAVPDPFDERSRHHSALKLHENQRTVGRNFLTCLRAGFAVAGDEDPALLSLCIGPAGAGKSTLIHALLTQVAAQGLGRVVVTGYTGVSCAPFLSPTLLTMCNLPARDVVDDDPDGVTLRAFRDRFVAMTGVRVDDLAGLIIDEISFLKPEVLGRVSRLFAFARGRRTEPFGGLPVLLAGHLSQLPPVGAAGTWFGDVLNEERRGRGDDGLSDRLPRETTRNFRAGVAALRGATRYDLTHNYRAHDDPEFAKCLLNLCSPASGVADASVVPYLRGLPKYDARDEITRFGPFATLSNAMRHAINQQKIREYGRLHRLPVFRWRWQSASRVHIPDDVYATEPSLWGYFCEGAPVQVTLSGKESNPARGVANGTCGLLVALQFTSPPSEVVRKAMSLSGQYNGECDDANGFVELKVSSIDRVVIRVSEGKWHGVDLPTNVTKVLPKLRAPLACGKKNNVARGCIALPLLHLQPKEARLTGVRAAYSYVPKLMKRPCSYELAFALTDYKLQGMTLERLVVLIGMYTFPTRHTLSSLYVMLSRVRRSAQLRILEGQPGSIKGLVGPAMRQRDELIVFDRCYDKRGRYQSELALAAYDDLVAQRAAV